MVAKGRRNNTPYGTLKQGSALEGKEGRMSTRRQRPGNALVLCVLGWLFSMFGALSFVRYRSEGFLGVFSIGASLVMMIGTLLFSFNPQRARLWSSLLVATATLYWVELFTEFGDILGLAWGLAGPFLTIVGGVLGLISRPAHGTGTVRPD